MHILLLAPARSVHSQRFVQMLLDAGHSVTLLDQYDPIPEKSERYTFIRYPNVFGLERVRFRGSSRIGHWVKPFLLRRLWQTIKPDIVHVHWVDGRAFHCARAGLHPLILSCWGSDINNFFSAQKKDRGYQDRISTALCLADYITADSPEVLQRCEELAGKKLNTSLFYFGIDLDRFKPGYGEQERALREKLGIASNTRVLLSVRAMRGIMGHQYILEAFARIANKPQFLDTVLALKRYPNSGDGFDVTLTNSIRELGLEQRVIWLDMVSNVEMPIHYALATVVVNYPIQDGFPVTFFEASACRRPVISSLLPAYEGIFDKDSFYYVPPHNPVALAQALEVCLTESPDVIENRLARASAIVRERGDQRKCFSVIDDVYNQLTAAQ